jgi:TonB family protein
MRVAWPVRLRGRLALALAASLAVHGLLALALWHLGRPLTVVAVKRGEPLFVELPETPDQAPAGNPAERRLGPPPTPAPRPVARPVPSRPEPPARPGPQPVAPPPGPAVVAARPAPPTPVAPPPAAPTPPVAESPAPPDPARAPAPAEPAPAATPVAAAPSGPEPVAGAAAAGPPPAAAPAPGNAPTQVAALPPGGPSGPPPVDIRSALRGGAGGRGDGRGGIEGEPVPLDTPDARYSEYFDRVRRMIKERWGYPCVKNALTRECEYKTASLVVEFGIAKDGRVPFVTVRQSSGWPIYDDYAVNAIKLAAPFPPIPDAISKKGLPVLARFNYIVDTSLTNLLR